MEDLIFWSEAGRTILKLKELGIASVATLGKYSYLGTRAKLETHVHEKMIEIVYCDSGQQIYEVNNQKFLIRGGDVFVTFPNEPHGTAEHPEEKGAIYWLQIEIPDDKNNFLGYSDQNATCLINALLNLPRRHFRVSVIIKSIFEEIFGLCNQTVSDYTKLVISHQITSALLVIISNALSNVNTTNDLRVEKVLKYINENLDSDLSIFILANNHHISESHFKRWFKKEIGITPMDYIQRQKIEYAKQQLAYQEELSITDIAFQLNFSSSQYFSTVFRKYAGMTPLEYRKGVVTM